MAGSGCVGPSRQRRHPLDESRLGDHVDRLYRAAWALCGSREDAEDLVQETFARVLARPRFLRRREDDLGYLLAALRNTFMDGKRAERRRPQTAPMPEEFELRDERSAHDPEAAVARREVLAAVSSLPEDFRDVLVAVDVVGLSYRAAAESLRVPLGTVMSRLYRARRHVCRLLEQ